MLKFKIDETMLARDAHATFFLFLESWLDSFCTQEYYITKVEVPRDMTQMVSVTFKCKEDGLIARLKDLPPDLQTYVDKKMIFKLSTGV